MLYTANSLFVVGIADARNFDLMSQIDEAFCEESERTLCPALDGEVVVRTQEEDAHEAFCLTTLSLPRCIIRPLRRRVAQGYRPHLHPLILTTYNGISRFQDNKLWTEIRCTGVD